MEKQIKEVFRFPNGMCMVFDNEGNQMPEYQGEWEKKREKIIKVLPIDAIIYPEREFKTEEWV